MLPNGAYGLLVMNRPGVTLTWRTMNPMLPSSFSAKGAGKWHPRGSEPPVSRIEKHAWLHRGWNILPPRMGYIDDQPPWTPEVEFKDVPSNGVYRLFVGNRVGESFIQSAATRMIPNL